MKGHLKLLEWTTGKGFPNYSQCMLTVFRYTASAHSTEGQASRFHISFKAIADLKNVGGQEWPFYIDMYRTLTCRYCT